MKNARPFIKWVGGKTQLLPRLLEQFPKTIKTYYEPFLGGGSVFWALAAEGRFERAILNDWNAELINAYRVIRDEPENLIEQLKIYAESYRKDPKGTFESVRAWYPPHTDIIAASRAARTIFLNKTCFNGLYRVNKKGGFNSPFGKYENPTICDEENIRACSAGLAKAGSLHVGDFASVLDDAGPGDLVYFDPPYVPVSATSDFTSYTSSGFNLRDQERLAAMFSELSERGVSVVLSNSDTQVVRDLYAGFEVHSVDARRAINSKGAKRGPVKEVIVVSRPRPQATEVLLAAATP